MHSQRPKLCPQPRTTPITPIKVTINPARLQQTAGITCVFFFFVLFGYEFLNGRVAAEKREKRPIQPKYDWVRANLASRRPVTRHQAARQWEKRQNKHGQVHHYTHIGWREKMTLTFFLNGADATNATSRCGQWGFRTRPHVLTVDCDANGQLTAFLERGIVRIGRRTIRTLHTPSAIYPEFRAASTNIDFWWQKNRKKGTKKLGTFLRRGAAARWRGVWYSIFVVIRIMNKLDNSLF